MGKGGGGGGGGIEYLWVQVLWPTKTKETISHFQNNNVKEAGSPPVWSNMCTSLIAVSSAVLNKVTKMVSEKQLLRRTQQQDNPSSYESPAPPLCSWSLLGLFFFFFFGGGGGLKIILHRNLMLNRSNQPAGSYNHTKLGITDLVKTVSLKNPMFKALWVIIKTLQNLS